MSLLNVVRPVICEYGILLTRVKHVHCHIIAVRGQLGISGVRVTRSLVLCVCFVDRCLSFCSFSFWLLCCLSFFDLRILITLWYLQTLLWAYKTSRSALLFIELLVPGQESERACMCVLGVSIVASFYDFLITFWNCSDSGGIRYFFLHFITCNDNVYWIATAN